MQSIIWSSEMPSADDCDEDLCIKKLYPEYFDKKVIQKGSHGSSSCSKVIMVTLFCILLSIAVLTGFMLYLYKMQTELNRAFGVLVTNRKVQSKPEFEAHIIEQDRKIELPTQTSPPTFTLDLPSTAEYKPEGIAASYIAHLYGNTAKLNSHIYDVSGDAKDFKKTVPLIADCIEEYNNSKGDRYCPKMNYFIISRRDYGKAFYEYFSEANWMKTNASNYEVLDGGRIKVKSSGMYQVHAHVIFHTDVTASIRLMKEDHAGKIGIVGGCYASVDTGGNKRRNVLPCSAFQVIQLREGEKIYMDIHIYRVFEVSPETLHITVLKLN